MQRESPCTQFEPTLRYPCLRYVGGGFLCCLPLGSHSDRFEQRSLLVVELDGIA
jgi:hypothetical protein